MMALPKSHPVIGKLQDGSWAVFNLPNTPLWDKTFTSHYDAARALADYYVSQKIRSDQ